MHGYLFIEECIGRWAYFNCVACYHCRRSAKHPLRNAHKVVQNYCGWAKQGFELRALMGK